MLNYCSTASRLRTDGHRTTEAGRLWDVHGKLQQAAHLHSPPGMETPQLERATCPTALSNFLQGQIILTLKKSFFLHSDGVFCVSVCAETVKVNAQGTGKVKTGSTLKNIQIHTQTVGV